MHKLIITISMSKTTNHAVNPCDLPKSSSVGLLGNSLHALFPAMRAHSALRVTNLNASKFITPISPTSEDLHKDFRTTGGVFEHVSYSRIAQR